MTTKRKKNLRPRKQINETALSIKLPFYALVFNATAQGGQPRAGCLEERGTLEFPEIPEDEPTEMTGEVPTV